MDLDRLKAAVQSVRTSALADGSRAATYLRTYPALLAIASSSEVDDSTRFLQLATVTYGWMPRILRLDAQHLGNAVAALRQARESTEANWTEVAHVAACLHSVVGASKLLHFANPKFFPIWDKKVERFRLSANPNQCHMNEIRNYISYASRVHELLRQPGFPEFYETYNQAFTERLNRLGIPPYCLTEVRSIESAAFELAGNGDD